MKNIFYTPLTAAPFRHDERYKEVIPVRLELREYIRCFWGTEKPCLKTEKDAAPDLVVPDTCADIVYQIDHTESVVNGIFCGINDASFLNYDHMQSGHLTSMFAIRFYSWGAYAFSEDSMAGTLNGHHDIQPRFQWLDRILRPQLLEKHSLKDRVNMAEDIFRRQLQGNRQNDTVDHAVKHIISHNGALSVQKLAKECFISGRQQERLFCEYIGITPKKFCNLIRYQCLWNEILRNPGFHILDAVHKYGFTDQSHLMREFKRYHTMSIREAKLCAYKDVENIQYTHGRS